MASDAALSYERLVMILRRSEVWTRDLVNHSGAPDSAPPYSVSEVAKSGEQADLVVIFATDPDFECRIRVALCDENGHPQHWTLVGIYLQEFLLTREYLEPGLMIERGPQHLVADGSNSLY